jgi:apolipoprotein N-acyltransferase
MKISKYLWFLSGSILIFTSNGRWMIAISIWITLICLLRFARFSKPWIGFISILTISFLSNIFIWKGLIPLPSPLYYIVCFIGGVFFSIPFLIERLLIIRVKSYIQTIIFPSLFTFFAYLYTLISPSGTFGSIAYSQSNIVLIQIVSVAGIWGIIFVLGWTASTVNYLLDNYKAKNKAYYAVGVYAFITGLIVIYGLIRISDFNKTRSIIIAGIVHDHKFNKSIKENLYEFIKSSNDNADVLFAKTKICVQGNAKIVFWSEAAHILLDSLEDALINRAEKFAQENNIYLGMSILLISKEYPLKPAENKIIWLTPRGKIGMEYLKAYPTPAEIVVKGKNEPEVVYSELFNLSSAICFDMNFPDFIRKYGKKNVDILCVPANDWREITPYHTNISAFRGIENGFTIVRAAGNGLSAAFHNDGRLISELNYFDSTERVIYADVEVDKRNTLYPYAGDFLPWLSLLTVIIITTISLTDKKKIK